MILNPLDLRIKMLVNNYYYPNALHNSMYCITNFMATQTILSTQHRAITLDLD